MISKDFFTFLLNGVIMYYGILNGKLHVGITPNFLQLQQFYLLFYWNSKPPLPNYTQGNTLYD